MTRQYLPQEPMFKRKAVQDAAERIAELEAGGKVLIDMLEIAIAERDGLKAQVAALTARGEALEAALAGVVKSRDEHCFREEKFVEDDFLPRGYWSPDSSMVGSDAIAQARAALRTPSPDTGEPARPAGQTGQTSYFTPFSDGYDT